MNKIYDALIIGGGPAGLSAALALGRLHRTCVVFSDANYRNEGVHAAHSILSRDHTDPTEIRRLGRKDIERYANTTHAETRVTKITRKQAGPHSHFLAANAQGQEWQGRTLILAAGVRDHFPDLEGYKENWPNNIYQCPICDGHERSNGPIGLLCYPSFNPAFLKMATLAHFLSQPPGTPADSITSSNVTFFSNGPISSSTDPTIAKGLETLAAHHIPLDERPVTALTPSPTPAKPGLYIHLRNPDGSTTRFFQNFLYHKPRTVPSCPDLIAQLGLETESSPWGEYVKTQPPMNGTAVPGVFVCGDAGTPLAQVTAAMASGNLAAAAAAHFVGDLDDEIAVERWRREKGEGENVNGEVTENGVVGSKEEEDEKHVAMVNVVAGS